MENQISCIWFSTACDSCSRSAQLALLLHWSAPLAWAQIIRGGFTRVQPARATSLVEIRLQKLFAAGVTEHCTILRTSPGTDAAANPGSGPVQLLSPPAIAEPRSSRDSDLLKDWTHAVSNASFSGNFWGLRMHLPALDHLPSEVGESCQRLLHWGSSTGLV